jgi:hypothetical protein
MNPNIKIWINRGGLAAVVVGVVLIVIGGGDVAAAMATAGTVSTAFGGLLVLIRELLG